MQLELVTQKQGFWRTEREAGGMFVISFEKQSVEQSLFGCRAETNFDLLASVPTVKMISRISRATAEWNLPMY